jgi:hypothetical protein
VETNEETDKIVQAVGNLTNVVINPQDISVSHRLKERHGSENPMSSRPPPIIVKFVRREVKEKLYSSRRMLRNKSTSELPLLNSTGNKIFILESPTKKNKDLFKETWKRKKELGYKFIWTQSGRIFTKKDVNSAKLHIRNNTDLQNMR